MRQDTLNELREIRNTLRHMQPGDMVPASLIEQILDILIDDTERTNRGIPDQEEG